MKRQSINKVGNHSLVTEVLIGNTIIGKYHACSIRSFTKDHADNHINGTYEAIEFIPNNHGGAGLSIHATKDNKAGRFSDFMLEIGKRDTELLIEFLQKHLENLQEYSGYEAKETEI